MCGGEARLGECDDDELALLVERSRGEGQVNVVSEGSEGGVGHHRVELIMVRELRTPF